MNEIATKRRNVRVWGALLIGGALVFGAYSLKNFGEQSIQSAQATNEAVVGVAPTKQFIQTYDSDGDGLRDWEEELLRKSGTISLDAEDTYTPPDTLTGQFGIQFFEETVRAKGYGAFGDSPEEVVHNAVDSLAAEAKDTLYQADDLILSGDNSHEATITYGNALALILANNSIEAENEAVITQEALTRNDERKLAELAPIAAAYRAMRDEMLETTVPTDYVSVHLDLLNVYNAILIDIEAMQQAFTDPLLTMIRMKRYPDDAAALFYALQNVYTALVASEAPFTQDDPAVIFLEFKPQ